MHAEDVRVKLKSIASPEAARSLQRYFKTGPGEYGDGDTFIGVRVPVLRKVAREFHALPLEETEGLLQSPIHEERLVALFLLVLGLGRCDERHRKTIFDLYVANMSYVNNWDLVDSSAPAIVGGYLFDRSRKPLYRWAKSDVLWERRIAIVTTQHFIRRGEFDDTLAIGRLLLADEHDLIHKATGWMLREVGDRSLATLRGFLDAHVGEMPRTMLRYAIEKLTPSERQSYLSRKRTK